MTNQQRISFDPDPPVQGKSVVICYDFEGSGVTVTHLEVKFTCASSDPPPTQHEVSTSSRCVTVHVPSDAETILVKDLDGPSPDKTAIVQSA